MAKAAREPLPWAVYNERKVCIARTKHPFHAVCIVSCADGWVIMLEDRVAWREGSEIFRACENLKDATKVASYRALSPANRKFIRQLKADDPEFMSLIERASTRLDKQLRRGTGKGAKNKEEEKKEKVRAQEKEDGDKKQK